MARMKPLPMAIIGIAVLGAGGYFLNGLDLKSKLPKDEPKPVAETVVAPPTQAEQQAAQAPAPQAPAQQAPAQQPVQQTSTLTPAAGNNSGMDAVLKAGKK